MSDSPGGSVRLERSEGHEGLVELVLDDPERSVNVLTLAALDDLDRALDALGRMPGVRALLVRSGKSQSFGVGADLKEIARIEEASIAVGHAARVHGLFGRLGALPFPVVAAVHGECLGGSLELALACHSRLASDDPATRLGLPEVKLGLLPGFGGTQRLPRLVGLRRAMDMILRGYAVSGGEAERIGLVDAVLPAGGFIAAARAEALRLASRGRVRRRAPAWRDRLLGRVGPARDLYCRMAEHRVKRETRGQYPAPEAAVAALREGLRGPLDEGLEVEAGLVGMLAVSAEAKSLIRVHFASEALRRDPGVSLELAAPIHKVGVVGAGVMGAGIAALLAERGMSVRLRDSSLDALGRGMKAAAGALAVAARRRGVGPRGASTALARIAPTTGHSGFRRAELVIEAVVENLAIKRDVLEALEEEVAPDAVIASNTSALSISELARPARRPGRIVGMHFFNPVGRMPLVEVVRGDSTSEPALATVVQLARDLGKVPIVVADGPGFLVNRVLAPYLSEALLLVEEGADPAAIEQAMRDFGMPMGPLELIDQVGLDVAREVAATLAAAFPERLARTRLLDQLIAEKRLGRKSGLGFYRHSGDGSKPDPGLGRLLRRLGVKPRRETESRGRLQERLILVMVNEAARALEQGIVRSPGEADLALILGAGFPAFRGGLLAFASTLGPAAVRQSLERLETAHGERFRAAPLIGALEERGLSFLDARALLS